MKLRTLESDLEGHPTPRLNFVDVATGSLGQGLSVACGMAYCGKVLDKVTVFENNAFLLKTYFMILSQISTGLISYLLLNGRWRIHGRQCLGSLQLCWILQAGQLVRHH